MTGLRAFVGGVPSGECELHRACVADSMMRGIVKGEEGRGVSREDTRSVLDSARDIMEAPARLQMGGWYFLEGKKCVAAAERIRRQGGQP